mmetsp:Transcript_66131/g.123391  ORF Transcript_66131/g.123391 Transcript_66131/m.123391 type:complete len:403 (+) Transcript_66131:90-1298(+)
MHAAQEVEVEVQERQTVYKPKVQYKEAGATDEAVTLTTPEVPRDRDSADPSLAGAQRRIWVSPPADLTGAMHSNTMGIAASSSSMPVTGSNQHLKDSADGPMDTEPARGVLPADSRQRATSSGALRRHEGRNSSPRNTGPCRNAGLLTRHAAPARPQSVSTSRAGTPSKKAAATPSSSSLPSANAAPRSPATSRERRTPLASPAITPRNGATSRSKTRENSAAAMTDFPVLDDVAKLERQSETLVHQLRQSVTLLQRLEAQLSMLRGFEELLPRLRAPVPHDNGHAKQRNMQEASFSMMGGNEQPSIEHSLLTQELERCHKQIQDLKAEVQDKDRVIAQMSAVSQEAKGSCPLPSAPPPNLRPVSGHPAALGGLGWSHAGKFEVRPTSASEGRGSMRHAIHG